MSSHSTSAHVTLCFAYVIPHTGKQELDFLNEANNQIRMKKVLSGMKGQVFVPDVLLELSTRRVLVSEWVDGVKLTKADPSEVRCGND